MASAHIKTLDVMEHIGEGETGRSWELTFQASFPNEQSPDSDEKTLSKKRKEKSEHIVMKNPWGWSLA